MFPECGHEKYYLPDRQKEKKIQKDLSFYILLLVVVLIGT